MKRKILHSFGILMLLFALLGAGHTALAAEVVELDGVHQEGRLNDGVRVQMQIAGRSLDAKGAILEALVNMEDAVDLSEYSLSDDAVASILRDALNFTPALYYVRARYAVEHDRNGNVSKLYFRLDTANLHVNAYLFDKETVLEKNADIEKEVQRILQTIDIENMSEAEMALRVHDWFALHYKYDTAAAEAEPDSNGNLPEEAEKAFRIDGLFIDKTAVCQGYALGYMHVLAKLGIDAIFVPSQAMNHAWNMVEIDGEWYHVDVTWDDPLIGDIGDLVGHATHENFLRSDAGIESTGHFLWEAPYAAAEDCEGFWETADGTRVTGGMFYKNGVWYYFDDKDIMAYDAGEKTASVLKENIPWMLYTVDKDGNRRPFGLHLALGNSCIYYTSAAYGIQSIPLAGGEEQNILSVEGILGLMLDENTLSYGIRDEDGLARVGTLTLDWLFTVQSGSKVTVTVTGEVPRAGVFFLALYQGDSLVGIDAKPFLASPGTYTLTIPAVQADRAQLYVWSDMSPLKKPIDINLAA